MLLEFVFYFFLLYEKNNKDLQVSNDLRLSQGLYLPKFHFVEANLNTLLKSIFNFSQKI